MYDCGFQKENNRFRYRTAAIIIEEGCVLFIGNDSVDYLYSVGGGVHMNEKAEDAVVREVFEEIGIKYEIDRLAIIHENFWEGTSIYDEGLHCHEVTFFYLMKPRGTQELNSDSYTRDGDKEITHWVPIEKLDQVKCFPSFLKEYLNSQHDGIIHIITDANTSRCV